MDEQTTQPTDDELEAQALKDAQAGYEGKARAQAPAEPEVATAALPEQAASASEEEPDEQPEPQAQPSADIKQQLDDLKAQVKQMAASGVDADTVRKMHGEIGEIGRTLKQLKALEKPEAPVEDDLTVALKEAEATVADYPELAGPLFKAIKALQARQAVTPVQTEVPEAAPVDVQQQRMAAQQEAAIKSLDEVHPDRHQIKESAEFKAWFAAKPPEYQKKVTTSWNPAVVAEPFTDYKAFLAARKRKQDRLDAAATPQGQPHSGPTSISDEEAARIGYERARKKRL